MCDTILVQSNFTFHSIETSLDCFVYFQQILNLSYDLADRDPVKI